jgi:hypothetical protein
LKGGTLGFMLPPATAGSLKAFAQLAPSHSVVGKTSQKNKKLIVCFADQEEKD